MTVEPDPDQDPDQVLADAAERWDPGEPEAQPVDFTRQLQRMAAIPQRRDPTSPLQLAPDDFAAEHSDMLDQRRQAMWTRVIPSRFTWAELDHFSDQPGSVPAELADWASLPRARNLLLLGPVGVGKTHAAVAACRQAVMDRGQDVVFSPVVELLDMLRPGGPDNALADLAAADLLVIDDLGSERPTEWTSERLYALINRRWLEERPTVATSNLPATRQHAGPDWPADRATLEEAIGERTFSRLVGNDAMVIRLTGPDRRRTQP